MNNSGRRLSHQFQMPIRCLVKQQHHICWELVIKHPHYINFGIRDSSTYVICVMKLIIYVSTAFFYL